MATDTTTWNLLASGNMRFWTGTVQHPHQDAARRRALVPEQRPHAVVLTCADSRVCPELIFDCGLGDIFTVRSAGPVVDQAVLGSVEYALSQLEVATVVVMTHTHCGAVQAAAEAVDEAADEAAGGAVPAEADAAESALPFITEDIVASVHEVREAETTVEHERLERTYAQAHARNLVESLATSPALQSVSGINEVEFIPALYDLLTGVVTRLDRC